jgi:hypothetical protein
MAAAVGTSDAVLESFHQRCISLLGDVAVSTALDAPLSALVRRRPYVTEALALQVAFVAKIAAQLKASSFKWLSERSLRATGLSSAITVEDAFGAVATPLQFHMVVVGCGTVGRMIIDTLRLSKAFHPSSLAVVSRKPLQETHEDLVAAGIRCYKNVEDAVINTDLVVLACQPSQFPAVAKGLKGNLKPWTVVVSLCCGIAPDKVASEINHVLTLATAIDVDSLSRSAELDREENERIAMEKREAYENSKRFSSGGVPNVTPMAKAVLDPEATVRSTGITRSRKQSLLAFPEKPDLFFSRILMMLALSAAVRGVEPDVALTCAWLHLFPKRKRHLILQLPPLAASDSAGGTDPGASSKSKKDSRPSALTQRKLAVLASVVSIAAHLGLTSTSLVIDDYREHFVESLQSF